MDDSLIFNILKKALQHILMRISFFNGGETFSALAVVDVGVELLVETAFWPLFVLLLGLAVLPMLSNQHWRNW